MAILKLNEKYTGPVALAATGLFLCASVLFFLPVEIPHKITYCVAILTCNAAPEVLAGLI